MLDLEHSPFALENVDLEIVSDTDIHRLIDQHKGAMAFTNAKGIRVFHLKVEGEKYHVFYNGGYSGVIVRER